MIIKQLEVVDNVEKYLVYEVIKTLQIAVEVFFVGEKSREEFSAQWAVMKQAFHLFMLDLEVEDFKNLKLFKDLKLPSERKVKRKAGKAVKKGKAKVKKVGKQLTLFFVSAIDLLESRVLPEGRGEVFRE